MSEPLGGCSDHLSSAYCTDTTLPLLETVSEESRKHSSEYNFSFYIFTLSSDDLNHLNSFLKI